MGPQFDVLLMVLMKEGCRKSFQDGKSVLMYFCSEGMPHVHVTSIERKPKVVGCELKNYADN